MRTILFLVGVLWLTAVSAHATTCSTAQPVAGMPDLEPSWIERSSCYASANCQSGTINCTGTSTCLAQNRNCSIGHRGFVACDDVYQYCGPACECTNGQTRWVRDGCCCQFEEPLNLLREQLCVDGQWEHTFRKSCSGICFDTCG